MIRKILATLTIFFLAVIVLHASQSGSTRRYLVAFSSANGQGMPRYLMEIDQNGKLIRRPQKITEPEGEGASTVGVFRAPGFNPVMWLRHNQSTLFALELDARTWRVISTKRTSMLASFSIDIGQAGASAFLTSATSEGQRLSYPVTHRGISTGKPLDLGNGSSNSGHFAGISSDGRAVLYSSEPRAFDDPTKLVFRTMNAGGQLTGRPRVVAERDQQQDVSNLWPADVSNVLSGNNRLIAYVEVPNGEFLPAGLFTRIVPIDSRLSLEPEIEIGRGSLAGSFGDVAVDPQGSFVLYTKGGELFFQQVGRDGSARGDAFKIVSNGEYLIQIDIIQQ